jgi:hypothetical protein
MDALTRRIAAALLLLAATVAAQTNASSWNTVKALAAGSDVRIQNGARTVRGKIEGVTDETIVVNSGKGQETFKQQDVMRVSLKKNGHRMRNALIGLGVGAGVGVGVGAAADANCTCFGGNFAKAIFTPLGAVAGVLVGALIPTGGWREIYKNSGA